MDARGKIKRFPATVLRGMARHLPRRADVAAAVKQARKRADWWSWSCRRAARGVHVESEEMPHF